MVSVVIPAHDAARHLPEQLAALAAQDFDADYELIVVDNRSTDGTVAVARAWADRLPLRLVDAPDTLGISYARNCGWRAAAGDFVLSTDADDVVGPGWLATMVAAASRGDLVGGPYEYARLNSAHVQSWRTPWPADEPWVARRFLPFSPSGNFGMWRDVLEALGGFNERYHRGATDVELCWRAQLAGYRMVWVPESVVHHRYRDTVSGLAKQFYRFGRADAHLYRDFRGRGMPPAQPLRAIGRSVTLRLADLRRLRWRRSRGPWQRERVARHLAFRAGRIAGSVRYRVYYP